MVNVSQPLPELEAAPLVLTKGWETQVGMSIKCLSGADKVWKRVIPLFLHGGKKAVQALAVAIATQVDKDQDKPVPVVELGKEHYTHKSYGRIYTPVFKVIEWVSMDVNASEPNTEVESAFDEEAPVVEAAPARRRRSGA
jgi:hypothetical protein